MRSVLVLGAIGGSLAATAVAAADRAASIEDFVSVCAAALLAPQEVEAVAARRDLRKAMEGPLGPGRTVTVFDSTDAERTVSITRQTFSDAVMSECTVSGLFTMTEGDVGALRATLEAEPRLGPFDGEPLRVPQSIVTALYKRQGSRPLLTVRVTATPRTTSLSMTHWDLKAGQ